jgi:hypothetical protein
LTFHCSCAGAIIGFFVKRLNNFKVCKNYYFFSYFLAVQQTTAANVAGLLILIIANRLVLFNPKLAWASRASMPNWVAKRVKPLTQEQVRTY